MKRTTTAIAGAAAALVGSGVWLLTDYKPSSRSTAQITCNVVGATPAPAALWGELEPGEILGDRTSYNPITDVGNPARALWRQVATDGERLYITTELGLDVWEVEPLRHLRSIGPPQWPFWGGPIGAHDFLPIRDVDVAGASVVVVGTGGPGVAIFVHGSARYGDANVPAFQVATAGAGGWRYAAVAARTGLRIYDLGITEALPPLPPCVDRGSALCGPFVHDVPGDYSYVSAVDELVVASSGGRGFGFRVWDISSPANPVQIAFHGGASFWGGVAIWRSGDEYFLAAKQAGGSLHGWRCSGFGTSSEVEEPALEPLWELPLPGASGIEALTYSEGWLYLGRNPRDCPGQQHEWLWDVSDPTSPREVGTSDYWQHYYPFFSAGGQSAVVVGERLYRAAGAVLDVHHVSQVAPPVAEIFADGFERGDVSKWSEVP